MQGFNFLEKKINNNNNNNKTKTLKKKEKEKEKEKEKAQWVLNVVPSFALRRRTIARSADLDRVAKIHKEIHSKEEPTLGIPGS